MEDSASRQLLPQSKVDRLLAKADTDRDGYLNYDEFVDLVSGVVTMTTNSGYHSNKQWLP